MRQWKHKIEIDEMPDDAQGAAKVLREQLSRLPAGFRSLMYGGDSLDDHIDMLDDENLEQSDFNDILREVYDWSDSYDLWLYLRF